MENYTDLISYAQKENKLADYMIYVTTKLVKDKKVLISILEHVNSSFSYAIRSYLIKQREFRRIPAIPTEPKSYIEMFFDRCAKELNISIDFKKIILKVNEAINAYNSRGMLLEKQSKYVFISSTYELIDFRIEDIKEYVNLNKEFVEKIKEGLNKG